MPLLLQDKIYLYGALRSELNKLSVQDIRNTVAAAGFDVSQITAKAEAQSGLGSRAEVMPAVDRLYGQMTEDQKEVALCILAERLMGHSDDSDSNVRDILSRHGFQYLCGTFVPIAALDARESQFIASSAAQELARAMGDTHGSKPALRQTAYDAIKWSSAICGILKRAAGKDA